MTCRELYLAARKLLADSGIDDAGTDSLLLAEFFLEKDRTALTLHGEEAPSPEQEKTFWNAVKERAAHRPLQYILGKWEFMGLSLQVGEGVLVPREDTAVPVEALAKRLTGVVDPVGLDLCAGTGAAALGLCSLLPGASVTCLEYSRQAFSFLERNLAAYPEYQVQAFFGDVLSPKTPSKINQKNLDFIFSNPPYIPTSQLSSLQPEVQKEPAMALDGGEDGLLFYRAICSLWLPLLKRSGGVLAVEIGEEQGEAVSDLFAQHGLKEIEVKKDWANLDRCVIGTLQ
ncbi:MAG: peptide chain release factor N(5)-glutamine methyltransferase [Acutalibacter sp.]|nr:peptide chain release factor N(5)-glutamine methyltransferase [Acutalibacter sp.]